MKDNTPDELDIEVAQAYSALCRLADGGKGFGQ